MASLVEDPMDPQLDSMDHGGDENLLDEQIDIRAKRGKRDNNVSESNLLTSHEPCCAGLNHWQLESEDCSTTLYTSKLLNDDLLQILSLLPRINKESKLVQDTLAALQEDVDAIIAMEPGDDDTTLCGEDQFPVRGEKQFPVRGKSQFLVGGEEQFPVSGADQFSVTGADQFSVSGVDQFGVLSGADQISESGVDQYQGRGEDQFSVRGEDQCQ